MENPIPKNVFNALCRARKKTEKLIAIHGVL